MKKSSCTDNFVSRLYNICAVRSPQFW